MKKFTFVKVLLLVSVLVSFFCYWYLNHTVTFMYVNPYTETAGMKDISKTIYELDKMLNGARQIASSAGYKFDYVYTNGYGSGFLKNNPIPNDLDYEILIDLGTFDYSDDKTKDDIADEIVSKMDAFQYSLVTYIEMNEDKNFYSIHSAVGCLNSLNQKHNKFKEEISSSLDDAISNKKYVNHLTKISSRDGTLRYYMPYVLEPGKMLLKDYPLMMFYSDIIKYNDNMLKYERILSITLSFCAKIRHKGKISNIEINSELASTGPLNLEYRLYAPNVFFRSSAIKYLKDLYSLTDGDKYVELLMYCFADHLKVVYPEDAFEFNPIKIFKRTLQLTDMIYPVLEPEEAQEIYDFIGANLQNRDIQLLNEYINIVDIVGRVFKSGKLYEDFLRDGKMKVLIISLRDVVKELKSRNNIPAEYMSILEDYVKTDIGKILRMKNIKEIQEEQKFVQDRKFRKIITPTISKAALSVSSDRNKMQKIINILKNIYFDCGFHYLNLYVKNKDTFILEKNEYTLGIKDFHDFALKNDLSTDMKFELVPKRNIPRDYTMYKIWVRYNTTPEQDKYYANLKKVLLKNKQKFKIRKKTYFVN